jgi:hypothetical protein
MRDASTEIFEGEIVVWLRSRCIGFQRDADRLLAVVESLVQPKGGAPLLVYQVKDPLTAARPLLRFRPRIDIQPPPV